MESLIKCCAPVSLVENCSKEVINKTSSSLHVSCNQLLSMEFAASFLLLPDNPKPEA